MMFIMSRCFRGTASYGDGIKVNEIERGRRTKPNAGGDFFRAHTSSAVHRDVSDVQVLKEKEEQGGVRKYGSSV